MDGSLKDDTLRIAAFLAKYPLEFRDGPINLELLPAFAQTAEIDGFVIVGVEVYDATHDQTKRKFMVYKRA